MSSSLDLTTTLQARGPAAALVLTDEQVAALGTGRKAFPVSVTVNGRTLALRLARMGGENLIGFSRAARAEAGVETGQEVAVQITAADAPAPVEVPGDLAAALDADPAARAGFDALPPSHGKEYVRWVTEAKREQTRTDRIARTVERVRDGSPRTSTAGQ